MAEERRQAIKASDLQAAKRILVYLKPYRFYFIGGLVLLALSSLTFLTVMMVLGEAADAAGGNAHFPNHFKVMDYAWVLIALLGVQGVVSYVRIQWFAIATERGLGDLRKDLFNRLIRQPLVFFEENRAGELSSRITADVDQLQNTFSTTLAEFIRQLILLVGGLVYITVLMPSLSLVMLAIVPLAVLLAFVLGLRMRRYSARRQKALAQSNIIVEEGFQLFSVVKSFGNEAFESQRFAKSIKALVDDALTLAKFKGLFASFIVTGMFGGILFILFRGLLMVEDPNNPMTLAELTTFIFFTGTVGGAIASLANHYTTISAALGATSRVQDILEQPEENLSAQAAPFHFKQTITLENLSFSYPTRPDIEVLKQLSLTIQKGQQVALVGPSGSGKSTLVKLIAGLYDQYDGSICIDDTPLSDIPLSSLRGMMATVPQQVTLFGTSIADNIRYGNPEASDEALREAAKQANALSFIEGFPEGFNTLVGDRGVQLSGGQKQRIAIARALLKDPKLLILDEATSALDSESEQAVQGALERLMEGRTSIVIAHRLSTIRHADVIVVLHNGRIIEKGHHDELMKNTSGYYHHLVNIQFHEGLQ